MTVSRGGLAGVGSDDASRGGSARHRLPGEQALQLPGGQAQPLGQKPVPAQSSGAQSVATTKVLGISRSISFPQRVPGSPGAVWPMGSPLSTTGPDTLKRAAITETDWQACASLAKKTSRSAGCMV